MAKKSHQVSNKIDLDKIFHWLNDNADMAAPIAVRAALRVLPLTFDPKGIADSNFQGRLFLQVLRATFVVWSTCRYRRSRPAKVLAATKAAAAAVNIKVAQTSAVAASAALAAFCTGEAASAPNVGSAVKNANTATLAALSAANTEDGSSALLQSILADMEHVDGDLTPNTASKSKLMAQPLWVNEVREGENFRVNFPIWARRSWDEFKQAPLARTGEFQCWIRWYESALAGRKEGHFERALKGEVERNLVLKLAVADDAFWDRDARIVNANIHGLIEEAKKEVEQGTPTLSDASQSEVDQPILIQRPSSHRFEWQDDRLEAITVVEPPFDAVLADTIIAELHQKIVEALNALAGNNADDVVARAVTRLSEMLQVSSGQVAEGILLMRANTLAAHSRSYADPSSERERAIRAVLDDLSSSLDNLVDCYPGIRRVSANRLALDMQAEQANEVEATIREVRQLAAASVVVGPSSAAALDVGGDELDGLNKKLSRETNPSRIADYVETRGRVVASRLLDATNFVSAILQRAGNEFTGLSKDTWREIRRSFPKAAADGIAKGTESAIEKAPIVVLAYAIAGPWAALAVLVPRLGGHARKAKEIKDKIEGKIGG